MLKYFIVSTTTVPGYIYIDFDFENIVTGVLDFLERTSLSSKVAANKKIGREKVANEFAQVEYLCHQVEEKVMPVLEIYYLFVRNEDLVELMDICTKDWITNASICRSILYKLSSDIYSHAIYRLLIDRNPKLNSQLKRA